MNKTTKTMIALGLCSALCLGYASATFLPTANTRSAQVQAASPSAAPTAETGDETKDETVYVLSGADGTVQKIIVSDWIKNTLKSSSVVDHSELTDIETVKGDESYTVNGDNMKVWDTQGNDIYYQGNIEKELPVGLSVTYKLNGQPISAEDIAGKSGNVTIRFDYDNRQNEMKNINGKQEKIYVPFAMLTGMLLDNDVFRNVEVSNGKLINNGDRTAVVGLAFPGLQENLGLTRDQLDIPDYVEITADTTNFSFGMTVTVATNEVFNDLDTHKLDSADDLSDSLSALTDGMRQLMDGSSALYDGLCTLLDKSGELVRGVNQLADGAAAIRDGAASLDAGTAQLKTGLSELSNGLNTLSKNNAALNSGAKQVFDTLLSTANTQLTAAGLSVPTLTISNYADVLNQVIASLDETTVYNQALQQVTAAVEANRPLIVEKVTAAVKEQVSAKVSAAVEQEVTSQVTATVKEQVSDKVSATVREQVTAQVTAAVKEQVTTQVIQTATSMSKADYDAAVAANQVPAEQQAAIQAAIDAQMASDAVKATIVSNTDAQMGTAEVKATIQANIDAQMKTDDVKAAIQTNTNAQMDTDAIKATIEQNINTQMQTQAVKDTIADNVELQVQQAVAENMASEAVQSQLTAASEGAKSVISLKASLDSYNGFYLGLLTYTDGVASAAAGASALSSGASDLKDGTAQLKVGAEQLYSGALQLKDGMPALVDGITRLKDGSMELSDGLKKFNEEGIQKIVDLVDGDLEDTLARLKATAEVSKHYRNFSGIADSMDGQVKFIYRTEEIAAK